MQTLSDAIAAVKSGHRDEARSILVQILSFDPRNITALLWMTEVSQTPQERREYLTRILEIDPNNPHARKGIELLGDTEEIPPWIVTEQPPAIPPLKSSETAQITLQPTSDGTLERNSPQFTTGWTTVQKRLAIAAAVFAVFIVAGLVNNYTSTQVYLENWNRDCNGVSEWLQSSRIRVTRGTQIIADLPEALSRDNGANTRQLLRDTSNQLSDLATSQRASNPPIAAQALNTKWMQFFSLSETGIRLFTEFIDTDDQSTVARATNTFAQATAAMNDSPALIESLGERCK